MDDITRRSIIADAKRLSYGLIALDYGLTRSQVAGIVWRHKNPAETRIPSSPTGGPNMCGRGRHGGGPRPAMTLRNTR